MTFFHINFLIASF